MISRSFCWAIIKKMTKKWDLETSNAEMELKIGIYAKNWAKQVRLKIFYYGQSQRLTIWLKSTVNGWRVLTWQCDITLGLTWQAAKRSRRVGCVWRVRSVGLARRGAWRARQILAARGSACSWGRNFSRRMEARVMQFLAVLGWVLLGIGCSVFLCLFFGNWMRRTLISECCRYCGCDGGGSLLTVTTRWRRRQRKNAVDVHRNQKVRGMALIPC